MTKITNQGNDTGKYNKSLNESWEGASRMKQKYRK